jgi:general secretion pathway protein B
VSYVLDALKKADAERERGSVPGLHAQPTIGLLDGAQPPRTTPPWVWLIAGAGAASLAVAAWLMFGTRNEKPVPPMQTAALTPATATPAPVPHLNEAASTPARTPNQTSEPRTAPLQSPPPAQPKATPEPTRLTPNAAVAIASPPPAQPLPRTPATTAAVPAPQSQQNPAPRTEPPAEGRIVALSELPEDVKRALPPLNVGSSMYSDSPASRFIMINGQIYHENDKLAPDLTLEQIRLKLAVLRYKDLRFRIMY